METVYLTLESIEESVAYTVVPFQQIVVSSTEFIHAELQRDATSLVLLLKERNKVIVLRDFFKAESLGFFPTFILPSKECISGFGFVALLNPTLLQNNIQYKGGTYKNPQGSFMDYIAYRKKAEESIAWTVSPILFTAPKSMLNTKVEVVPVEDESPEFYQTIEQYISTVKEQNNEHDSLAIQEDAIFQEYEEEEEYEATYNEHFFHEDTKEDNFPSYHSGYVFTQEQINAGYRVCAINGDANAIEQMVGGYYGYLTLASEGWFTYILGEGVLPEVDGYLEDSYNYTIVDPEGNTIEGMFVVQSYYVDGVLTYKEYYTEV